LAAELTCATFVVEGFALAVTLEVAADVVGNAVGDGVADAEPATFAATRVTVTASTACAPDGSFAIPVRCAASVLRALLALGLAVNARIWNVLPTPNVLPTERRVDHVASIPTVIGGACG